MMYLNGKLYFRCSDIKPKPFVLINPETLEELKDEFELEKEENNLEWKEDEKTGRFLTYTPLITDGKFIYVISQKKEPKKEDKDNEPEDKKEEEKKPILVLEKYDSKTYKFISEQCLYKNKDL